ncbi:MAG: hypothetical protein MJ105_06660 [Lachnospiraceae bacterium]|nr:hypothetical protein [Lachnospiraceae bacterium]
MRENKLMTGEIYISKVFIALFALSVITSTVLIVMILKTNGFHSPVLELFKKKI